MSKKLRKTSVQLTDETLEYLNLWSGLSQSEALRLVVERYQFLERRAKTKLAPLAQEMYGLLEGCFDGLDYRDFRAAQALIPESVLGKLSEHECIWLLDYVVRKEADDDWQGD